MKSSTGEYFAGLDHLRAVAILMVFSWHFITLSWVHVKPPPIFPLSILSEGHSGVALWARLGSIQDLAHFTIEGLCFSVFIAR